MATPGREPRLPMAPPAPRKAKRRARPSSEDDDDGRPVPRRLNFDEAHASPERPKPSVALSTPTRRIEARVDRTSSDYDDDNETLPAVPSVLFPTPPAAPPQSPVTPSTQQVYSIVRKSTGAIGGNGEITMASLQRIIDVLKAKCGLDARSSFIDVGSGLGKPNLHVAQDPGVAFSYGIEMEEVRWQLSMHNLIQVMSAEASLGVLKGCVYFAHGDITEAACLDPFSHVYMFDVGFPPRLLREIGTQFNRSNARCLVSYQPPRVILDEHEFDVRFLERIQTSMHGSSERHSCFVYTRDAREGLGPPRCDPLFAPARAFVGRNDPADLLADAKVRLDDSQNTSPRRRRTPTPHFQATS